MGECIKGGREPRARRAGLIALAISLAATVMIASAQERQESRFVMTLIADNFPSGSYLEGVYAKIAERWGQKAIPGKQPIAAFGINRDGHVTTLAIQKSSGKAYYDEAVLRAITEAAPFAPLPVEFSGAVLRVRVSAEWSLPPSKRSSPSTRT